MYPVPTVGRVLDILYISLSVNETTEEEMSNALSENSKLVLHCVSRSSLWIPSQISSIHSRKNLPGTTNEGSLLWENIAWKIFSLYDVLRVYLFVYVVNYSEHSLQSYSPLPFGPHSRRVRTSSRLSHYPLRVESQNNDFVKSDLSL